MIGVAGCLPKMPPSYPLQIAENAGNMIHARAPLRVLKDTVEYHTAPWGAFGEKTFADFVNKHCSHLVISMTNTVKVNSPAGTRYSRFRTMLDLYDVPIVIFGLGVRSPTDDLSQATIPQDAIDLLQHMQTRCGPIGVRGDFTKRVFTELAGLEPENVVVTGCPSFFSDPKMIPRLRTNLANGTGSTYSYAGTRYDRPEELAQFVRTVQGEGYYIETTSADNHRAHVQALAGQEVDVPPFLQPAMQADPVPAQVLEAPAPGRRWPWTREAPPVPAPEQEVVAPAGISPRELGDFYRSRYRLFRNPDDWLQFNREVIDYGFGTRFHVNMATFLAAKPATWITHDTRTREFCDFLHLPHVSLEESAEMAPEDFRAQADYESLFDHVNGLFDNFRDYLDGHGLPHKLPRTVI